ncbi:3-deoxy-D-arabino-heptulosonate 7-phosphate synthase [Pigmentiphaga soli]
MLRTVPRRYRLPPIDFASFPVRDASPSTALAITIERAREALARGHVPDAALKHVFVEALARLIHDAMRPKSGDPVFQAMVLRHRMSQVRQYASLAAHAEQDRRLVRAAVNAVAHPARQRRILPGPQREALARLHAFAASESWPALYAAVQRLLAMPEIAAEAPFERGLMRLLDHPALERLRHLQALAQDAAVRQYLSLCERYGPRSGTAMAAAQGAASQRRGAAVEALAMQGLEVLARRLEAQEAAAPYRVVTSMRVPASIAASRERAKGEWDAVLLRHAGTVDRTTVWDVCLLVEAKASVDAASTDLPRLLRGLRLLAHAEDNVVYPFATRQGTVHLRGACLRALTTDEAGLARTVLYCCDAPAEASPRLLGAASRMQLLSAQASLEFAAILAEKQDADPQSLVPVWYRLSESPGWRGVLHQYPMLRRVRELMVHADDLLAAGNGADDPGSAGQDINAAHGLARPPS